MSAANQRRLLSRSDEEIFDEIDERVPYRLGWPLPLHMPPVRTISTQDDNKHIPDFDSVKQEIRTILDSSRVTLHYDPFIGFRSSKGQEPTEDDLTVVIPCEKEESPWMRPLMEIRKALKIKDINCRIEMFDFNLANRISHTVLPTDPIVSLWANSLRSKVLPIIRDSDWQSVNVLRRGISANRVDCPITLVITARDSQDHQLWRMLIQRISSVCSICIELLSAENTGHADLDLESEARPLPVDAITGVLRMGTSVSLENEQSCGTIGGFCKLKWPNGKVTDVALTNYHVIRNTKLRSELPRARHLCPSDPLACQKALRVTIPSDRDVDSSLKARNWHIETLKKNLHGDSERIGLIRNVEVGDESKRDITDHLTRKLDNLEKENHSISSFSRAAGFVLACSGDRTTQTRDNTWPLDWAIIELSRSHDGNAIISPSIGSPVYAYEGCHASTWTSEFADGRPVSKLGRTTGWTSGVINPIKSDLSLPRVESGQKYNVYGIISVWCVLSTTAFPEFAKAGDSGSWIIINNGEDPAVIGLYFAGEEAKGIAYYIPFDIIVADIEAVTGATLIFPGKAT